MPNWCYNGVTLRHSDPAMIDRAQNSKGLLMEFLPTPKELLEGDGWYNWNVTNWGTKWDVDLENVERVDPNTLTASFDSAWSPPIEAYQKLVEMGFEIEAKFYEPGMAFCGTYDSEYGENTYELSGLDADNVRDVIGEELDDYFGISEEMAQYDAEQE